MELLNLQKIRQVVTTQIQTNKEQKSYNFGNINENKLRKTLRVVNPLS